MQHLHWIENIVQLQYWSEMSLQLQDNLNKMYFSFKCIQYDNFFSTTLFLTNVKILFLNNVSKPTICFQQWSQFVSSSWSVGTTTKWLDALRGSSPAHCNNGTWQCDAVQKTRIQYNTMQYHTIQWNDMQYHAMKLNKIQNYVIAYNSMK